MSVSVKNAKELLKQHKDNKLGKKKRNFSTSLDSNLYDKLEYLSTQTKTSKNEIITNALLVFGLNDIDIPINN
jgi:hypothetical protein